MERLISPISAFKPESAPKPIVPNVLKNADDPTFPKMVGLPQPGTEMGQAPKWVPRIAAEVATENGILDPVALRSVSSMDGGE